MADARHITRRALLGTASLGAAASVAMSSAIAAPSPIMVLFEEWDAINRHSYNLACSDAEMDGFTGRMRELECQMEVLPSTSAADLAAKIVARTNYGDFDFNGDAPANQQTWAEMERLLGRTKPLLSPDAVET